MAGVNPLVDQYFIDGCGRCNLYKTPQCKVHKWAKPMHELRQILLSTELVEEEKWKQPTYTIDGGNVLMLSAFNDFCCLAFFKGSLMTDSKKVLEFPGENSQSSKRWSFTDATSVLENEEAIRTYIAEAIQLEKTKAKVAFKKKPEEMPEELATFLEQNDDVKQAFYALTPGRQRGYILHFSGAKQSATRMSRILKHVPKILEGKGFHDR